MTIDLNTLFIILGFIVLIGVIVAITNSARVKLKHGTTQVSVDTTREKDNVTVGKITGSELELKNRPDQNIDVQEVKNSTIKIG